jgi:hypothetical protein
MAGGPRFVGVVDLGEEATGSPPPWIAIGLNGRLEAVARPVRDRRNRSILRAMLPEAALRPRGNVIELYRVRTDGASPKLVPLESGAPVRGRRGGTRGGKRGGKRAGDQAGDQD